MLGMAAYEPCSPRALVCIDLGRGGTALVGGIVVGGAGVVLGSVIGALAPGETWGEIPASALGAPVAPGELRVGLAPTGAGGVELAARLAM